MKRWAELGLLLVVLIWGVNFAVMKGAIEELDPLAFNALRFSCSVALLGLFVLGEKRPPEKSLRRALARAPGQLVLLGLMGHVVYQTTFILGLERTTAGNSALILASSPLWTALLAQLTGEERLRDAGLGGLLVAFVGTLVLTVGKAEVQLGGPGGERLWGDLLTLLAAMGWGAYTAGSGRMLTHYTSTSLAFASMAAALPAIWLLALPSLGEVSLAELGGWTWGAIAYSGALSTGLAYVLWNVGIRHVGSARTAAYLYLIPVVALVVAYITLGETVGLIQLLGGALVIAGLAWMRSARGRRASSEAS